MILLVFVAVALIASLLLSGRLEPLALVRFRYPGLILLALAVQLLAFSAWWRDHVPSRVWSNILYIASMCLLIVSIVLNRRLQGIFPLAIGLLLNTTVIVANGGYMPASLSALSAAGLADALTSEATHPTNSSLMAEGTPLWFMGDILALPAEWPLANVFSPGDVLIAIGAAWFVFANTRVRRASSSPDTPSSE